MSLARVFFLSFASFPTQGQNGGGLEQNLPSRVCFFFFFPLFLFFFPFRRFFFASFFPFPEWSSSRGFRTVFPVDLIEACSLSLELRLMSASLPTNLQL